MKNDKRKKTTKWLCLGTGLFWLCYLAGFGLTCALRKRFDIRYLASGECVGIAALLIGVGLLLGFLYYRKHYWLINSKNIMALGTDIALSATAYPNDSYSVSLTSATGIAMSVPFRIVRSRPSISINGASYQSGATLYFSADETAEFVIDKAISDVKDTGATIAASGSKTSSAEIKYADAMKSSVINRVFLTVFVIGAVLLVTFTIVAIIKSAAEEKKNVFTVLKKTGEAVVTALIVPFCVLAGILLTNAVMGSMDSAMNAYSSGRTTIGGQLLVTIGADCYTGSGDKSAVMDVISSHANTIIGGIDRQFAKERIKAAQERKASEAKAAPAPTRQNPSRAMEGGEMQ